jgi:ubiquinone/menaquinone biosynthesis C-methylase UbiE
MPDRRDEVRAQFDTIADVYDTAGVAYFTVFADRLLDDLDVRPGERVLDVGTGAGAVLLEAARRVGPDGSVLGIDLSPGMVDRVAGELTRHGLANARVEVQDAEEPDLPAASFDVVTSAVMAFFLPDPAVALDRWRRLLVPGGRLGMTTFGGDDPRWSWLRTLYVPYLPVRDHAARAPLFASDETVDGLVAGAGFTDVRSVVRVHEVRFDDGDHWLRWTFTQGHRADWDALPPDAVGPVVARARQALGAMAEPDGSVLLRQPVRYTYALAP